MVGETARPYKYHPIGGLRTGGDLRPGDRIRRRWCRFALAIGLCLCLVQAGTAHGQDAGHGAGHIHNTVMVANAMVGKLTKAEVRDIYIGEQEFVHGLRVVPLIYKDGDPLTQDFFATILESNEERMRVRWITLMFRGHGSVPKAVDSERKAAELIAVTPGAIGVLEADQVPEGVNILFTIPPSEKP